MNGDESSWPLDNETRQRRYAPDALAPAQEPAEASEDGPGETEARGEAARLHRAPDDGENGEDIGLLDTSMSPSKNADPKIGLQLKGQYEVQRRLGEGGMGSVYTARSVHFDEEVAVKFLTLEGHGNASDLIARFRAEQDTLRRLRNSRIVGIRGDGVTEDGQHFLIMDLVQGRPLNVLLDEGLERRGGLDAELPIPPAIHPSRMLRILIDVAIALEEAHAHGIVHRDLKPANLILEAGASGFETTKVLDFGVAKVMGSEGAGRSATLTGMIIGTLAYLSPEQTGEGEVVPASDLYSLGAMTFHCLTGELPFTGTPMAILQGHGQRPPPSFADVAPRLERSPLLDELERVVLKLMAKPPTDRFGGDAALLRRHLEGWLHRPEPSSAEAAEASSSLEELGSQSQTLDAEPKALGAAPRALGAAPKEEPSEAAPAARDARAVGAETSKSLQSTSPPSAGKRWWAIPVGLGLAGTIALGLSLRGSAPPEETSVAPSATTEPSREATEPKPEGTASKPEGTASKPEGTASKPEGTGAPDPEKPPLAAAPPPSGRARAPEARVEVIRSAMVAPEEQSSLESTAKSCAQRVGLRGARRIRLGGIDRVVIESIEPRSSALRRCIEVGVAKLSPKSALGFALELKVQR